MGLWRRRERGSYTLELVGVFVGVAVLLVSVADVVSIFQARSVVRAAVNEGLRCLYPTDAGCADGVAATSSPPWKRYNVSVWGAGYRIPQESLTATARWQTEPVYEVPVDESELVSVNLEHDPYQYAQHEVLYPTRALSAYLIQSRRLPHVNDGTPLDPYFVDPITRAQAAPQQKLSLSRVRGTTTDGTGYWETDGFGERFKIGGVSFSMKDAWPTADADRENIRALRAQGAAPTLCYSGPLTRDASGVSIAWESGAPELCAYRGDTGGVWDSNDLAIPFMFRVTGSTRGTHRLGDGRVLVRVSWRGPSGQGSRTLGGRRIVAGGSGAFVPRGLAWEDIRDNIERQYNDYQREIDLYGRLPLIPRDASVTLEFFLVSVNKRPVTWSGDSVELFYPRYQMRQDFYACGYSPDPRACAERPKGPISMVSVPVDATLRVATVDSGLCSSVARTDAQETVEATLNRIASRVKSGESLSPVRFIAPVKLDRKVCQPYTKRWPCVREPLQRYLRGCAREEEALSTLRRCGIPESVATLSRFISADRQIKSDVGEEVFRGCATPQVPQCAKPHVQKIADDLWYPSPEEHNACPESQTFSAAPLVLGPFHENSCRDRSAEVQNLYRVREKVPVGATVQILRTQAEPIFSMRPPPDACTPFAAAEGTDERLVCGRGVSAAKAEQCCLAAKGRCAKEEVPLAGGGDSDYMNALVDVATRRVVEGVQAGYPRARFKEECEGKATNCVQVDARVSAEDLSARVSARLTIPLRILKFVTGNEASVEYAAERRLERHVFSY